jgi:hypothetical protein
LRRGIARCPAGRPERCGGPRHARWSPARGPLEPPGPPGCLPAAFRHWRDAGLCLPCRGGRSPCALLPAGAQAAGRQDGCRAGQGRTQGASGRPLGVRGHGLRNSRARGHGHAQRTDEGLDAPGMGGTDARVSGQGRRGFPGVHARGAPLSPPPRVGGKAGLQGGPPGQWCRVAGGPTAQTGTAHGRIVVLTPVEHVGDIVRARPGEALGDPPGIPDDAATGCDPLGAGTPGRTLRLQRGPRVARGEEPCEVACGIGGGICGAAGRKRLTRPRPCQRRAGQEDEHVLRAPGGNQGPFGACAADGPKSTAAPEAPGGAPGITGLGGARTDSPHAHQAKALVMDLLHRVRVDTYWEAFSVGSSGTPRSGVVVKEKRTQN